jgi:hypothetical protein
VFGFSLNLKIENFNPCFLQSIHFWLYAELEHSVMNPPNSTQMTDGFLIAFKRDTEAYWRHIENDPDIYGFQFQKGTRWNKGLTPDEIKAYENALGVHFPNDFKRMLGFMNGTDLPTVNIYGSSGNPHQTSVGVYTYSRDLKIVQDLIERAQKDREEIAEIFVNEGFNLETSAALIPIYAHRYIVCSSDLDSSVVLSIMGTDAIIYGNSLRSYLLSEFSKL